ncbi:membrane protein [Angustibacter peucedani]
MLNKVPEVTVWFWVIKVLATTVGETAADYLNVTLGLGLTLTTIVMGVALVAVLVWQFRATRYVPSTYWLAVVLISIVGTLFTDNLVDGLGVPLQVTTLAFAIALAVTFTVWYRSERTLSIHSITTTRRESFYWLAILFTFALGTAAGDLLAEGLGIGYFPSVVLFAVCIAMVAGAHYGLKLGAVLSFWIAYVLTRPLGASLGDFLSQAKGDGGLGLGTVVTSAIFLVTILVVVVYLTRSRRDVIELHEPGSTWSASDDDDLDGLDERDRGRIG